MGRKSRSGDSECHRGYPLPSRCSRQRPQTLVRTGEELMRFGHLNLAALLGALLVLLLAGCETKNVKKDVKNVCIDAICERGYELGEIASYSLKLIERIGAVTTFIVPANLDVQARKALADLRPVVDLENMPTSGDYSQPKGYFLVQIFSMDKTDAAFEGKLGPVLKAGLPGYEDNCGTTFIIPFEAEDKEKATVWANHSYKFQVCSSTNVVVPVGQQSR
jgi:hypothetical protein